MVLTWYIFLNNLKSNIYGQVYSYKHCSLLSEQESITEFLQGLFHSLKLQEIVSGGVTFSLKHKTKVYCPKLLNSVTDDFIRDFWNSFTKTKLENIQKNLCCGLSSKYKYSLHPTIELKTPPQVNFESAQKEKDILKARKFQKNLCKFVSFFITYACNSQFVTSRKTDSKKNVPFECSDIVRSLRGKGPQWSHLIKLTGLLLETKRFWKITSYIFQRMLGKTAVLEGLEKRLQKNVSSRVPCRQFELSNPPTYENWLHRKCLMCAFREIFKLLGERIIAF